MPAVGLRTRVSALLGVVLAIMLGLIVYLAVGLWNNQLTETRTRLENEAQSIAARHGAVIARTGRFIQLNLQAEQMDRFAMTGRCPGLLKEWFLQQPELAALGIAHPEGELVCDATSKRLGINVADRAYFQDALRTRQLVIGQAVANRLNGRWSLPFAQAIPEGDVAARGVFIAMLDLSALNDALAKEKFPADARVGLIDAHGLVLARYPDLDGWIGRDASDTGLFKTLTANHGSGSAEGIGFDGVRRIFAFARFADTSSGPLYLWIGLSKSAVTADIERQLAPTLGIALVLLLLTIGLAWRASGRIESSLARSEAHFRAAAEASPDPFIILGSVRGPDGKIVDFKFIDLNKEAERRLGFSRDDLLGKAASETIPQYNSAESFARYVKVVETRQPMEEEIFIDVPDTKPRWVRRLVVALEDGVALSSREITAAKAAEQALRASEERWKFALEGADIGVWDWDVRQDKAYYSPRWKEILGYRPDEIGDDWDAFGRLYHPDDLAPGLEQLERLRRGEIKYFQYEFHMLHKDGQYRWFASRAKVTERDAQGEALRVIGIVQDITAAKLAEAELRASQHLFRSLADALPLGLYRVDREHRILFLNQHMVDNLPPERRGDYLGRRFTDLGLATQASLEAAHRLDQQVVDAGRSLTLVERYEMRPSGQVKYYEITRLPVKREDGAVEGLQGVVLDITEQVEAENEIRTLNAELEQRVAERTRQLEAALKELEAFSYSLSHDLRSPLRSVDGFSRLLEKKYADSLDETGKDYLARIHKGAQRMEELIEDILTLSQVSRSEMGQEPVDLSTLSREILAELASAHPERQVHVVVENGVTAEGDWRLLRIALENLLGNAWKFTSKREDARIQVGRAMTEHGMASFIRDNGAGFDMRHAGKLFTSFQRLHSSSEFPGSGIGLAIVQRVISRHAGRIWLESVVGEGTCVYFVI